MRTRTGWTGGQYSIYRALLALLIGPQLIAGFTRSSPTLLGAMLSGAALLATIAIAAGWRDRWAAGGLAVLAIFARQIGESATTTPPRADVLGLALLLALHACVPPAPFGAWEARSRPDPAGDWNLPGWLWHAAWGALALFHGLAAGFAAEEWRTERVTSEAGGLAIVGWILEIFVVVAALHPPLRRAAWSSIVIWQIAWTSAFGGSTSLVAVWLLHLLAFDPGWIPARSWLVTAPRSGVREGSEGLPRLFYDGDCGFCHHSVRFILSEESATPDLLRLHFAPLDSPAFEELLGRHALRRESLPDSLVLELEDGSLQTQSTAALEIASRLGGLWRALSVLLRWIPSGLLDRGYDAVARVRKRLFAQPKGSCPLIPPGLRDRFLL